MVLVLTAMESVRSNFNAVASKPKFSFCGTLGFKPQLSIISSVHLYQTFDNCALQNNSCVASKCR